MTTLVSHRRTVAVVTSIALLLPLTACAAVADVTATPTPSASSAPGASRSSEPRAKPPAPPAKKKPAGLFGTQYAYVTAFQGNRVTFDLVEFFEGRRAAQACAEDGVVTQEGVWCTEFYIRNQNPRLRRLGADPAGPYRVLGPDGEPQTVTMEKFLQRVRGTDRLVKLAIDGGRILNAEEMWQ